MISTTMTTMMTDDNNNNGDNDDVVGAFLADRSGGQQLAGQLTDQPANQLINRLACQSVNWSADCWLLKWPGSWLAGQSASWSGNRLACCLGGRSAGWGWPDGHPCLSVGLSVAWCLFGWLVDWWIGPSVN